MYKQLIICLETNMQSATDEVYIKETINRFYILATSIKISYVYMGSKTKYASKQVAKQIEGKRKAFSAGKSYVIVCTDTDNYDYNSAHKKELEDICSYCKENKYDHVWFCHDVEEVYLGKRINNTDKVKEAARFRKNQCINKVDLASLNSKGLKVKSSNIVLVLDKYLARKEQ